MGLLMLPDCDVKVFLYPFLKLPVRLDLTPKLGYCQPILYFYPKSTTTKTPTIIEWLNLNKLKLCNLVSERLDYYLVRYLTTN